MFQRGRDAGFGRVSRPGRERKRRFRNRLRRGAGERRRTESAGDTRVETDRHGQSTAAMVMDLDC